MIRPRTKNPELPRCVYLRHGAYYLVRAGKWIRLGIDLSEALALYGRLIAAPTGGGMAKLIDDALPYITRHKAPATVAQYGIAARRLSEILAEFSPEQVTPRHVVQIRRALAETPNMANRIISVLRLVFDYALEEQLIDSNPCTGVKRLEEDKRERYITDTEFLAIYAAAGPRLRVIMDLCYLTAQRPGDVLAIKRADLSDEGIAFRQQKTGKRLVVKWSQALRDVIETARALHGNISALTLLHNRRGKAPDYRTINDQWVAACEAAKVQDAQLRDLRAKALTDAEKQGIDPQAIAGHSSPAMTARYLRQRQIPVVQGPSFGQSKKTIGR